MGSADGRDVRRESFIPANLPVVLYATALVVLYLVQSDALWEPVLLQPLLNAVVFGAPLTVAVLATIAFLRSGRRVLIALALGVYVFGLGSLGGPVLVAFVDINAGVSMHNTMSAIAGALLLVGIIVVPEREAPQRRRIWESVVAFVTATVIAGLLALGAANSLLPTFIGADGEPTHLRTLVLDAAIVLFLIAGVVAEQLARFTKQRFMLEYGRGLIFVAYGLLGMGLGPLGSAINWLGLLGQIVGMLGIASALLVTVRSESAAEISASDALASAFQLTQRALDDAARETKSRTRATNRILEAALTAENIEQLGDACLTVLEEVTGSAFGFIDMLNGERSLHQLALSDAGWMACGMQMHERSEHVLPLAFPLKGLYGHVIDTGESFWTNSPHTSEYAGGVPENHPVLTAFLGVPLKRGEQVVGVVSLANRTEGYDASQAALVESLAPAIVSALDRKGAADELARSKQVLDAQLYNSPVGVIEFDATFRVIRWSSTAERIFGYRDDEVLGKAISDFHWVYEEDAERVQAESTGFIDGTKPRSLNVNRNYRKDGSIIWCEWYSSATYDTDGALTSVLSLVLDVTERRATEDALQRNERRFELLSGANSMLLAAPDPESIIQPIAEQVMAYLDADVFFNYVLDPGAERLRLNAWGGIDEQAAAAIEQLNLGQAVCGCVARDCERIISDDVQHNNDRRADLVRRMGVQSYVCHPLTDGEHIIGTLSFGTKKKPSFSDAEIEFMHTIAVQVSIAMSRKRSEENLRQSEGRFRSVLENSLDAAYRRDLLADCYDYISPVIELITGFSPEEFANLTAEQVYELVHPDDLAPLLAALEESSRTGAFMMEYRFRHKDGHYVWLADHASVSFNSGGVPWRRSGIVRDVSHHRRVEKDLHEAQIREAVLLRESLSRSDLLKELATAVASSLQTDELSARVLSVAQRRLGADLGVVYLLEGAEDGARESAHIGYESSELTASMPLDSDSLSARALVGGQVQTGVSTSERPVLTPVPMPQLLDHRVVSVPMSARGQQVGTITLGFPGSRSFGDDEIALYRAVAEQLAVGLENARLYESERDIAETLQETLVVLPAHVPGVEFSRAYESSTYAAGRVGGDFVDIFEVHPEVVGISLGDVSGKGIDAAVTTSLVRTTLRVHALDGLPAEQVVEKANSVMRRFIQQDSFVTLWFGLLDVRTGHLRYVSAGHPPAFVLSPDGSLRELNCADPFIGAFSSARYTQQEERLARGERLVLYSDGLIEARSASGGELFGEERLQALLMGARETSTAELSQRLMDAVLEYSNGSLRDDCAVLVVEPTAVRRHRAEAEA